MYEEIKHWFLTGGSFNLHPLLPTPWRYAAMSGDIFICHNSENETGAWWVETKDAAKHPIIHKTHKRSALKGCWKSVVGRTYSFRYLFIRYFPWMNKIMFLINWCCFLKLWRFCRKMLPQSKCVCCVCLLSHI